MSNFDFSIYDEEDSSPLITKEKPPKPKNKSFDFDDYEISETKEDKLKKSLENDKFYQAVKTPEYSPEEIRGMSFYDKMKYAEELETEQTYLRTRGSTKAAASRLSFGQSEKYPGGELYGEPGEVFGSLVGDVLPIAVAGSLIGVPLAIAGGLLNFGTKAMTATRIASSALTGAGLEAGRQAVKGEGFDPAQIATQAIEFGAIHSLFELAPTAWNWIKSLNPGQQSEVLVKGVIPENLSPNQYKFYENEVLPEIQNVAKQEYEQAYAKAVEENNLSFEREMANTKAQHEKDLYEISKNKQASQEDFSKAQESYDNKLKQVAAEHQAKTSQIEQQNELAAQEFEKQQQEYALLKTRQQVVNEAIQPKEGGEILQGKVTPEGEDVGIRPSSPYESLAPLEIKVGNIVSPNSVADTAPGGRGNKTTAGKTQIEAVRANDAVDYKNVQDAYTLSEDLNGKINAQQPNLVQELISTEQHLTSIPKLSPVQEQQLTVVKALLEDLAIFSESGELVGLKPINNNTLQEQAKALRYFMDFNFQHGNSRGILSPTVNSIEDAISFGATMANDEAALNAHKNAKRLYSEWAKDYDNPYIRPYRDTSNQSFVQTFENSLSTDNFNPLNKVLEKSNAGQQVSGMTRRALVDKYLAPFYDNPRGINSKQFNEAISELGAVITPQEERAIRNQFNIAKQIQPPIKATKIEGVTPPKEPKLKTLPTREKIPLFRKEPAKVSEPTSVKVPIKKEVKPTDAMRKAAHKLNMKPEEGMKMADSISGFRELKQDLLKSKNGKQLVENLEHDTMRKRLYKGKVHHKFKGNELKEVFNEGDNFQFFSEILGEEAAEDLLKTSEKIADKKITLDNWKKFGGKVGTIKIAHLFGIL